VLFLRVERLGDLDERLVDFALNVDPAGGCAERARDERRAVADREPEFRTSRGARPIVVYFDVDSAVRAARRALEREMCERAGREELRSAPRRGVAGARIEVAAGSARIARASDA
jgi:hypothetical protein